MSEITSARTRTWSLLSAFSVVDDTRSTSVTQFLGKIIVYSIFECPKCRHTKQTLNDLELDFEDVRFDLYPQIREAVCEKSGIFTVPQIYFNEVLIGGDQDLQDLIANKPKFREYLDRVRNNPMPKDAGLIFPSQSLINEINRRHRLFSEVNYQDEYYKLLAAMDNDRVLQKAGGCCCKRKRHFTGKGFLKWFISSMKLMYVV